MVKEKALPRKAALEKFSKRKYFFLFLNISKRNYIANIVITLFLILKYIYIIEYIFFSSKRLIAYFYQILNLNRYCFLFDC